MRTKRAYFPAITLLAMRCRRALLTSGPVSARHRDRAVKHARWLTAPIRKSASDLLQGANWDVPKDAKHGTEAVAGLAGAILTITLALVAYVQVRPEPNLGTTMVYLGLTFIPWVGMCVMYRTRAKPGSTASAFDRGTKMLARCLILATAFGVAGTALAFEYSLLPGQVRHLVLPVSSAEPFPWPETDEDAGITQDEIGVRAYVFFFPLDHRFSEVPKTLTIEAALDQSVASSWHIASARGYRLDPRGNKRMDPTPSGAPAPKRRFFWRRLQLDSGYLLELRLKQVDRGVSPERLIEKITEGRKSILTVKVYYLRRQVK